MQQTTRRRFTQSLATTMAASFLTPWQALAQELGLVKIVNGFPAGGTADTTSRRIGERLAGSSYTRNPAVVENKVGAAGRIACEAVKNAPADGATLLLTPYSCMAIYPHSYARLGYDPVQDFTPISTAAVMTHGFAVGPAVPPEVRTLQEFLAWLRNNPRHASYGTPGAGSTPHFIGALIGLEAGIPLQHVAYRGSVPAITDLVGGQIAATLTPTGDTLAHYKAGKIRLLATSGAKRTPFTPDVPTLAEAGFPALTTEEWFGFYAPARTPAPVVSAANAAIQAALKERTVIDSLATFGLVAQGSTPEQMAHSQRQEFQRWGPLVKKTGFTAES